MVRGDRSQRRRGERAGWSTGRGDAANSELDGPRGQESELDGPEGERRGDGAALAANGRRRRDMLSTGLKSFRTIVSLGMKSCVLSSRVTATMKRFSS